MYKVKKHAHLALTVTDLDRTVAFYEKAFGFKFLSKYDRETLDYKDFSRIVGIPNGRFICAQMNAYGFIIEVVQYINEAKNADKRTQNYVGQSHIAFSVEGNLEELYTHIKSCGAKMLSENVITITEGALKGTKSFHCTDENGFVFEFLQSTNANFY